MDWRECRGHPPPKDLENLNTFYDANLLIIFSSKSFLSLSINLEASFFLFVCLVGFFFNCIVLLIIRNHLFMAAHLSLPIKW